MSNKISDERSEIDQARDWCTSIIDFIEERSPSSDVFAKFRTVIDATSKRNDLRGMKCLRREMSDWGRSLSEEDREGLEKVLFEKFGRGLAEAGNEQRLEVQAVLKKGKIESELEYRALIERADEIYADDSAVFELKRINGLLAAYHKHDSSPSGE